MGSWVCRYQLHTPIPDHWLAPIPVTFDAGANQFELGTLIPIDTIQPDPTPSGRLLGELASYGDPAHRPVHISEKELARVGVWITPPGNAPAGPTAVNTPGSAAANNPTMGWQQRAAIGPH
jgi:hypothetical protein